MANPDSNLRSESVTANIGYKLTREVLLAKVLSTLTVSSGLITSEGPGPLEVKVVESRPFLEFHVNQAALNNGGYQGPLTIYSANEQTAPLEYLEQLKALLERG